MVSESRVSAWLALVSRVVVSGLFMYSGVVKLAEPEIFARAIQGYRLVSDGWIVPLTYFLPWLEVWCALVLWLAPPFRRAAWEVLTAMLGVFTVAKASAMWRGLDISCGCTGSGDPMGWGDVALNVWWLVLCGIGLAWDRRGAQILRVVKPRSAK